MKKRSVEDTRMALIRAAEKLFAERGVDAVSLREVSVAAGQANNSAVGYHFGSREGLIDAILERHSMPIQERYVAQLDALERHGKVTARAAVEIMALPIVAKLDDPDGGWAYLSLCAQLSVSPSLPLVSRPAAQTSQVMRLMQVMWRFTKVPPELSLFRLERTASTMYAGIVQWHRLVQSGTAHVPRAVFEQDLVDALVDIVERPASAETLETLANARPLPPDAAPAKAHSRSRAAGAKASARASSAKRKRSGKPATAR